MDYVLDAKNKPMGRIAAEIAGIIQGKRTPKYVRRALGDDRVIVKNIASLNVTGRKYEEKVYHRHTGYMGHLKTRTFREGYEKDPAAVLRHAVLGMLPKNFLRAKMIKKLVIEK